MKINIEGFWSFVAVIIIVLAPVYTKILKDIWSVYYTRKASEWFPRKDK